MIAKLKGVVDSVDNGSAVIDVNGVGYLVSASSRTLRDLVVGGPATLLVETIVREDAIALYGFLETAERDWFRILTTVQGVGARVALSILSTLSPDEIARAIAAERPRDAQPPGRRRTQARRASRHRAQGQGRRLRRGARTGAATDAAAAVGAAARSTRTRCRRWSISAIAGSRPSAPWRA